VLYIFSSKVRECPILYSRKKAVGTNRIQTGYFAINHRSMGSLQDVFGQLWKEYALSDSRYLTQDPFVLCMETITAVCSTLSLTTIR